MPLDVAGQWRLAREALLMLFRGQVELRQTGEYAFEIAARGNWYLAGFGEALSLLKQHTGPGRDIDPFQEADGTAWVIMSYLLSAAKLPGLGLDISLTYLDLCYDLQAERERRIHKGAPLFWTAERFVDLGDNQSAAGYTLLALIEDVKFHEEPASAPAFHRLRGSLGLPEGLLNDLIDFARSRRLDFPMFPEEILVDWQLRAIERLREGIEPS